MVNKGNHPQMAARFRLVKYYNLPIYIYTPIRIYDNLWLYYENGTYIYIIYTYMYRFNGDYLMKFNVVRWFG